MTGNNSTPNNSWVRLNVGGKVFQTKKDTLLRNPDSFLACLVNGRLPSDKDETGAFLIDRDPKHFRVILNYLRNGVLHMERNEVSVKELFCEADFYGLHALVKEIRTASNHIESVTMCVKYVGDTRQSATIFFSETNNDYEVLQALRDMPGLDLSRRIEGTYKIVRLTAEQQIIIETALRGFGFVQDSYEEKLYEREKEFVNNRFEDNGWDDNNRYGQRGFGHRGVDQIIKRKCWKFVRTISK